MKYISDTQISQYELDSIEKFHEACHKGKWGSEGLRQLLQLVAYYGNLTLLNRHCKQSGENYNTLKKHTIQLDGVRYLIDNF